MSYEPTSPIGIFPPRAVQGGMEPAFTRYQPLIDAKTLKDLYLFGIPLKSSLTGEEMEVKDLEYYIINAISQVEHELRISISPVEYEEPFDYRLWDYVKFNFIQVRQYPIRRVISVKGKFPNSQDFLLFPSEWYTVDSEQGIIRITPTNGSITQFFLTNDAAYLPLILGSRTEWPHLWSAVYESGFPNDKVPAMINDLIGLSAAIQVLDVIGPVLFPYGSYSIGIDGVSQGVSTQGVQQFQMRLTNLKERYEKQMDIAKHYYAKNLQFFAI